MGPKLTAPLGTSTEVLGLGPRPPARAETIPWKKAGRSSACFCIPAALARAHRPVTSRWGKCGTAWVQFEDPEGDIVSAGFEILEGDPATIEVLP